MATDKDGIESTYGTAFTFVLTFALMPVQWLVTGTVAASMWGWFVVPIGGPPITWAQATGLAFVVGMFQHAHRPAPGAKSNYTNLENVSWAVGTLGGKLVAWFFAWVFYSLMVK